MGLRQFAASVLIKTAVAITTRKHYVNVDTARGNYTFQLTDSWLSQFMNSVKWSSYTESQLIGLYHNTPEVYSAIHQRAFRVSRAKWIVKKVANNEPVTNDKHLNRLMSKPNPLQNWQELIYEMQAYKCVTGNNFMFANAPDTLTFNYKNINTLWNLFADVVTIRQKNQMKWLSATVTDDLILDYEVNGVRIPTNKVMHTKFANLNNVDLKLRGMSPLQAASPAHDNLKAVWKARNVIFTKGGALGFISSDKSDADGTSSLTPEEVKEINQHYSDTYGLDGTKTAVGVVKAPVKFTKIGASIQELQPFEESEAAASAVYAVMNVPRSLMPRKEGATYENAKQDERSFYQNIIIPEAQSLAQSLTNFLGLDAAGLYIDVSFEHIDVLQENKKEKSEVDSKNNDTWYRQFLGGIITLNDWRVNAGLEKVTGNKIYEKLVYDMEPEDFAKVEMITRLLKGGGNATVAPGNDNQNNDK